MASLRRPAMASSSSSRRTATGRPHPASLASLTSSAASSSTASLLSPPLPGLPRRGESGDVRQKREPTDSNIQVVVRCRGVSPSETNRNVRVVAEVKATRGTEVKLVDPNPTFPSSASFVTAAPGAATAQSKTWDFGDRVQDGGAEPRGTVYGPDADQGMLYNDVAKPILQQVLQGYNCTIFAYGQTGTGKTYTMEGNLSPYHGTFHPDAGLVPRTLYSLFDRLAESKCEYSVRCSFIELYNEELRDLNASDSSDISSASSTASSPEPGAAPRNVNGPRTLRIYEETKNGQTGVTIQGLEETFVQNAEEGLRVLRRGSERRQIAATNCNERSSRSHSIFTINVHVKDTSNGGQDVLKVGKLNLVDLAGSENVGRSGAVQGRAREAGMINASLLALGRVINQLVDKTEGSKKQHIAYRESKLTRLLQDSLGGRTKTTIIATISPVSYEETASTLTYAHQAKSIQNRPEVNQRVSRTVMLNQFATEIERLKADLNAARGQEGVYVSKETWDELEDGRLSFDETKRKLEITESQLQTTRDQFEQNFRLLSTREEQLGKTKEELITVKNELAAATLALEDARLRLAQQEVLRDAFETSREGWKSSAGEALDDVEGLRAKLDRKTAVEEANLATIAEARSAIAARTRQIDERATHLQRAQVEFVAQIANQLDDYSNRQQVYREATCDLLTSHLDTFAQRLSSLSSTTRTSSSQAQNFATLVNATCATLHHHLVERSTQVEQEQRSQAHHLAQALDQHKLDIEDALKDLLRPVQKLSDDQNESWERDQGILERVKENDDRELREENARLKNILSTLHSQLSSEQTALQREEANIVARVQAELATASTRRLESLSEVYQLVEREVTTLQRGKAEAVARRQDGISSVLSSGRSMLTGTQALADFCQKNEQEVQASTTSAIEAIAVQTKSMSATAIEARAMQLRELEKAASLVRGAGTQFRRDASTSKAAIDDAFKQFVREAGDAYADWQASAAEVEHDAVETVGLVTRQVDAYSTLSASHLDSISTSSTALSATLQRNLNSRVQHDLATGATPAPRPRPVDKLLPSIDLDADRPSVLGRLLALRSQEVAATTAALEDGGEGVHTVAANIDAAPTELPPPVAVVVPVAAARASLVPSSLKGEMGLRKKVLGERDQNIGVRRIARKVIKGGK